MDHEAIEAELAEQAKKAGVSVAKLRCIYTRGVSECVSVGSGSPALLHGIVRVERYLNAIRKGDHRLTMDSDLLPTQLLEISDDTSHPLEMGDELSWPLVASVVYSDCSMIAEAFKPWRVLAVTLEDDCRLIVHGERSTGPWEWSVNLTEGVPVFIS